MKTLKIGDVVLKNRYILAPMAGITDLPFRLLCREFGAGMAVMEMVSAKAITYNNKKTFQMLRTGEDEHPSSLQLFGSEPEVMAEAVRMIEEYPFDLIDINMGCPVPKVVKNGEGSALLKNPKLAGRIIDAMVKASSKPITVKFRIGFDKDNINAVEFAKMAEASGAAALTVHGRTREQYYEGKADWKSIAEVKAAVKIPVIGNGDLFSVSDVRRMEEETGVDGFGIARGAKGNPWIFKNLVENEEQKAEPKGPDITEVITIIKRHARALIEEKGDYIGIREMRKHAAWYLAGQKNSSKIRGRLNEIETLEELDMMLNLLT